MKQLKIWIGLAISAICVYLAVKDIEFSKVGDSLSRVNWLWIAVYAVPYVIVIGLKVTRWQLLFYPDHKNIGYQRLFSSLMISYLWNTILPARLGEIVRAYAVSRSEKIGVGRVLSTILLEKILDIITMMFFLLALLPFMKLEDWIKQSALIVGGGVIFAFLVCLVMAARRNEAEKVIGWFLKWLPTKISTKLHAFVSEILDTLRVLLDVKASLNLWGQSILMWAINATLYLTVAWAIGLPMSLEVGILVMITTNLGMVVPSSPGYVGTFELVIITTLKPFYAPGQDSLLFAYALLQHIVAFLPVVIAGAFYTWREGLSLGKVDKTKVLPPTETEEKVAVVRH